VVEDFFPPFPFLFLSFPLPLPLFPLARAWNSYSRACTTIERALQEGVCRWWWSSPSSPSLPFSLFPSLSLPSAPATTGSVRREKEGIKHSSHGFVKSLFPLLLPPVPLLLFLLLRKPSRQGDSPPEQ